jgi:hypothetical protein
MTWSLFEPLILPQIQSQRPASRLQLLGMLRLGHSMPPKNCLSRPADCHAIRRLPKAGTCYSRLAAPPR